MATFHSGQTEHSQCLPWTGRGVWKHVHYMLGKGSWKVAGRKCEMAHHPGCAGSKTATSPCWSSWRRSGTGWGWTAPQVPEPNRSRTTPRQAPSRPAPRNPSAHTNTNKTQIPGCVLILRLENCNDLIRDEHDNFACGTRLITCLCFKQAKNLKVCFKWN